jgi:signal transduction histidine kinase/CheY-like chemotaxis protein/ABC-type amino acid transport substrate-binding protein
LALICLGAACQPEAHFDEDQVSVESYIQDYRTIPQVTDEEILAIETFRAGGRSFSFGTLESSEAFALGDGTRAGFLLNFSGFLSALFDAPFQHVFYERGALGPALAEGWLDFASEVEWGEEGEGDIYFQTDPIYQRVVKVFTAESVADLSELASREILRFGFTKDGAIRERVLAATLFQVEAVEVPNYEAAAQGLLSGELDAFFEESSAFSYFEGFEGIKAEDYFPPIDLPLALGTGNPELRPFIAVVQKFLNAGGAEYLSRLYADSLLETRRVNFQASLTPELRAYLAKLLEGGAEIRVAAESDDYPVSFHNGQLQEFQGIAHDVIGELTLITGLKFRIVNEPHVGTDVLEEMTLYGDAQMLSSFNIMNAEQFGLLISRRAHSHDHFALLTTLASPEIEFNQIFYGTVGLARDDRRGELFRKWFPEGKNYIYYRSLDRALDALKRGDIAYVVGSSNLLLSLTNYREDPSFKAGIVFAYPIPYGFAFNAQELELRDLIHRAMSLVPTAQINERWSARMFDYNRKFLRDIVPYAVVSLALLVAVVLGLIYENLKNRRLNRDLESLVAERTKKLMAAQGDLERERQLFQRILDSCPVCFVITVDRRVAFLTPFASAFLGKRQGDSLVECFAVREEIEEALKLLDEGENLNWKPMKVNRADGATREVLVNSFVSDYYGQKGLMSWFTDVTELRENARDLAFARDVAEDSAKAKSEFLANMSHEIRTPMNAIVGLTQLALQTDLSEIQKDYLEKTGAAAKSLLGIINDILDFSKIEAGKLSMESVEFQLEETLDNVLNLVAVRANEKNLELLLSVAPDTPTNLLGDPLRLGQVLNNLMSNAVKFTEKGRVALTVSASQASQDKAIIKFLIKDTGIGLTNEQKGKLFTAFNQADTSVTRRFGGTGLGLAISKRLVEMMGGDIWCEGIPDVGSVFGFTAIFGVQDATKRYASFQEDFKNLVALAVDDYEPALQVLVEELKSLGLQTLAAESGEKALEIIKSGLEKPPRVDVAILDWKMPGLDGVETAEAIRADIPTAQRPALIIATAHDRDEIAPLAAKAGVKTILPKPILVSSLLSSINESLSRRPKNLTNRAKMRQAMDASSVAHLKGSLILLAEDNEVNQLVARRLLKNAGFEVDIANNGREAFEKVQGKAYALVLMDIQMPEMDGLTATRAIRALPGYGELPIVAMTAHAMSGDRDLSLAAGMNDHITKPINLDDLFAALNRWIQKK